MTTSKIPPGESRFKLDKRSDGRFTILLSAIEQESAIQVSKDFWGGIMPGTIARMLRLEGPLDARGGF